MLWVISSQSLSIQNLFNKLLPQTKYSIHLKKWTKIKWIIATSMWIRQGFNYFNYLIKKWKFFSKFIKINCSYLKCLCFCSSIYSNECFYVFKLFIFRMKIFIDNLFSWLTLKKKKKQFKIKRKRKSEKIKKRKNRIGKRF